MAWDSLPLVAQEHVLGVIDTLRRLQAEHEPISRLLWPRSDPKRVRLHMRRIERYQTANRSKRRE